MQRSRRRSRDRAFVLPAMILAILLALPGPAQAAEYDRDDAGNPVYIAGTIAYPLGFVYEAVILRPAHWLGKRTPFRQLFGQDTFEEAYEQ